MRFIDKDNLLRDLSMIRYMLDDEDQPSVKFSDKQIKSICKYIENYIEDECIKCDVDYWLRYYDILTKEWKFEEDDLPPIYSFRVVRKSIVEDSSSSSIMNSEDQLESNQIENIDNEE
ncbi:MAG: hypothetical protein IJH55_09410 [Romboutsia sp.]|nr:hypothetical protein [Romboutsia sp.]